MLITSLRMSEKAEKDFKKLNVSNTFTVAGRSVYLHTRAMWKEI